MTSPALIASHLESSLKEHRPWVIALWDELISDELAELGRQMPRIPLSGCINYAASVGKAAPVNLKRNEANNEGPNPMRHRSPLHPR